MANESLKTLAGTEMVIVRNWHISTFTFLISFVVLFVFFYSFQPTTLLDTESFLVPGKDGNYQPATSDSDKEKSNKLLTDHGRTLVFAWAIGLGALVGLVIHFLLIYI
jgi:hypothetical protein